MTDERLQIVIMQRIAKLIQCAADLSRAVAYEDGTYIRADLSGIETHRSEILAMIHDWKPELLARRTEPEPPAEQHRFNLPIRHVADHDPLGRAKST